MVDITVDEIPDETYDKLARRAARAGIPLEDFVRRHILGLALLPSPQSPGNTGLARPQQ